GKLLGVEGIAYAGVAEIAYGVAEGALGDGCGKAVGVADDPVGHVSAVGAAENAQLLVVDLGIRLADMVCELHEVVKVHRAVFVSQIGKDSAPAVGASGVA